MKTKLGEIAQSCLDEVNQIRWELGLDPLLDLPKGQPLNAYDCPVAKALSGTIGGRKFKAFVASSRMAIDINGRLECCNRLCSAGISTFIKAFDRGLLPEYEAKKGE